MRNKHGLSRYIPNEIRRIVRHNSGFGCVICGAGICNYDHVSPEWNDATKHESDKITLLCGRCHDKKSRRIYSVEKIQEAMKNPKCKTEGFTFDHLDMGLIPRVFFGDTLFYTKTTVLKIDDNELISFTLPIDNEPYKLNAKFYDNDENSILDIKDNIWHGNVENWDIECEGTRITVRQIKGEYALILNNIPRQKMIIEKINMRYKQYHIVGNKDRLRISTPEKEIFYEISFGSEVYGDPALEISNEKILIQNAIIKSGSLTLRNTVVKNTIFDQCKITLIGNDGGVFENCSFNLTESIKIKHV